VNILLCFPGRCGGATPVAGEENPKFNTGSGQQTASSGGNSVESSAPVSVSVFAQPAHVAPSRGPSAAASAIRLAVLALAALAGGAHGVWAQAESCPGGIVREVAVDNHSIFDVDEIDPEHRFRRWFFSLANRTHRRTRQSFVRKELLFRAGDCLDPLRLEESERILRSYRFIADASVDAVPVEDGVYDVVVQTHDEWSLELNVRPEFDDGFRITRIAATEENLLGTGTRLGVFRTARRDQQDFGADLQTPRLGGTRLDARFAGGTTRSGYFFEESLAYPFVAEIGKYAFAQDVSARQDFFAYAAAPAADYELLMLPFETARAHASMAMRLGRPGDFTVLGAGLSWEELAFDRFPAEVATASGGDLVFLQSPDSPNSEQAHLEVLRSVASQSRPVHFIRLSAMAGRRQIRFVERRGLDAIRGEQDVRVGFQALGSVGVERRWTPSGEDRAVELRAREDRRHDFGLQGQTAFFAGLAGETWVFNSDFGIEGAWLFRDRTFRNILGELGAHLYWQPHAAPRHTLTARLYLAGGWRVARPFQLTIGGPDKVRGYGRYDFPVGQAVVFNLEDRIAFGGPLSDAVDLSLAVFLDAGAGWPGQVPFGAASGLRASVGAGFRVGFPAGTQRLPFRLDAAVPLQAGGLRSIRFRIGVSAVASLLEGFGNPQMDRSRNPNPAVGLASMGSGN